jgi:hypothetical protein
MISRWGQRRVEGKRSWSRRDSSKELTRRVAENRRAGCLIRSADDRSWEEGERGLRLDWRRKSKGKGR